MQVGERELQMNREECSEHWNMNGGMIGHKEKIKEVGMGQGDGRWWHI